MSNEKMLSGSEAYKQLSSLFGEESIVRPDSVQRTDVIRSGSPGLDYIFGVGGWPRGRFIQLAGSPSSGKTLLTLQAIAEWQSLDPENCAAFLDAEYTYDPAWAAKFGVDNNRIFLVKSNDAAQLFTGLVGRVRRNKVTQKLSKVNGLLDMIREGQDITSKHPVTGETITLKAGKLGVIVLDSIAALQAPMEVEAEVGKQNMAPIARFLSTELKKITPAIANANVAFIAINQVRINIGQMFGNPETSPGGKALGHACSLMVEVGKMNGADNTIFSASEEQIGHRIRAKVTKNKIAPPNKKCEFLVDYGAGIIRQAEEVFDLGVRTGFIKKVTAQTYSIGEEKASRKDKVVEYINSNFKKIEQELREFYFSGLSVDLSDEKVEVESTDNPFESSSEDDFEDV